MVAVGGENYDGDREREREHRAAVNIFIAPYTESEKENISDIIDNYKLPRIYGLLIVQFIIVQVHTFWEFN